MVPCLHEETVEREVVRVDVLCCKVLRLWCHYCYGLHPCMLSSVQELPYPVYELTCQQLLAPANEALGDGCLTGVITEYPWAEGIALMTVFSLFFAELMTMRAAQLYDAGLPCGAEANAAKYLAADAGFHAADRAIRTHGGMGYEIGRAHV